MTSLPVMFLQQSCVELWTDYTVNSNKCLKHTFVAEGCQEGECLNGRRMNGRRETGDGRRSLRWRPDGRYSTHWIGDARYAGSRTRCCSGRWTVGAAFLPRCPLAAGQLP